MKTAAGAVVLVVAGAVPASGCGEQTVDSTKVEQSIEQQVGSTRSPVSQVECPADVKSEAGATFQCGVTLANSATGKVKVTEPTVGHYEYSLVPGSVQVPGVVLEKDVQQSLAQKGLSDAAVNCPDNIIVKVGTYVTCDVTGAGGTAGSVKFTFSNASGTVDSSSVTTA